MTQGTNPVGTFAETVSAGGSAMTATAWFAQSDANSAVMQRVADDFAPHPAASPAMSVVVDAGFLPQLLPNGQQVITEVAQQTVTVTTAPGSPNNRLDVVVVDTTSGTASVVAGTPATSPTVPTIPAGKLQVAIVSVPNGTSAIGNSNIYDCRAVWLASTPGVPWQVAGGTADALSATFPGWPGSPIPDGFLVALRAAAANATTTPTLASNGGSAITITRVGGVAVRPGDIPGALAEALFRYNQANTRWELLNPATAAPVWGVGGGTSNALTLTASPAVPALYDGLLVTVRDNGGGNTSTTPTFTLNGLGPYTIVKGAAAALAAGDMAGSGAEYVFRWNATASKWWFVNAGVSAAPTSAQVIAALGYTPAQQTQIGGLAGVTTIGGATTLTSAQYNQLINCGGSTAYNVTLPTPGTVNGLPARIILWCGSTALATAVAAAGSSIYAPYGGPFTSCQFASGYGGWVEFVASGSSWLAFGITFSAASGGGAGGGGTM